MWRKFQVLMIAFFVTVVLAEGWRCFTSGNVHAGIDAGICFCLATIQARDARPHVKELALKTGLLVLFAFVALQIFMAAK
jgi:hypothetical protein